MITKNRNDRKPDLLSLLVEIAHLYYDENLSQQEIADRLSVSRSSIAQYLQQARDRGIVRIEVVNPTNNCEAMALEIQDRTNLERVFVVPSTNKYQELTMRAIAGAASTFLEKTLTDSDILGIAWGRTISRIVQLLAPSIPREIDVVPLMGERGYTGNYSQINQLVLQTAKSFGGHPYFLLAPMFVGTNELRDALLNDPAVSMVVERWDKLTTAIIGIGAVPPQPGSIVYVGTKYMRQMQEQGAVGDICGRHFDADGKLINAEFYDRMISISLDQIRKIKHVIAVAGGVEKREAVIAALRTKLFSVLFIDELLAENLLFEMRKTD
jgi:DNA-binding transcriptional regulator LsrR (DeoR family)